MPSTISDAYSPLIRQIHSRTATKSCTRRNSSSQSRSSIKHRSKKRSSNKATSSSSTAKKQTIVSSTRNKRPVMAGSTASRLRLLKQKKTQRKETVHGRRQSSVKKVQTKSLLKKTRVTTTATSTGAKRKSTSSVHHRPQLNRMAKSVLQSAPTAQNKNIKKGRRNVPVAKQRKPSITGKQAPVIRQRHVRESRTKWNVDTKTNDNVKKAMLTSNKKTTLRTSLNRRAAYHQSLRKPTVSAQADTTRRKKKTASTTAHTVKKASRTAGTLRKNVRPQSSRKTSKPTTTSRPRGASPSKRRPGTANKRPVMKRKALNDIKVSDFHFHSLLGEGAFSRVYLTKLKDTAKVRCAIQGNQDDLLNEHMALKVIPAKKEVKSMVWERHVLAQLDHPFIVKYHGAFTDANFVCIMLQFSIGGEILYHFEQAKHGRFDWESVGKFYIAEITSALSYLHTKKGLVYRDLKPENVLLDAEGHIKLVDFGFARKMKSRSDRAFTLCGSKEYVAPEVLTGRGHSFSVDLWSLGVLAYEFTVGHLPFPQDNSPSEVLDAIKRTTIRYPPFVSGFARDFISKLLVIDVSKRLGCITAKGIEAIKGHACFQGINWKSVEQKRYKPPIVPRFKSNHDASNYETARFDEEDSQSDSFTYFNSLLDSHF